MITDTFNSANTQTCTYGYDDLARVASGNCGSVWSQTFSYDAFGNLTKAGSESFNPGYNSATNQMSTGATYDLNGDVLTDSLHSYAWNVDTRPTTIDTVTVTYDALGRMVEQSKSGTNTEIVYDALGNKLALMNGLSTLVTGFVSLPAGAVAVYNASGLQYYRHADWLGSARFSSTPTRTMYNDLAYAPFGEQYAQAGSTGVTGTSFAGMNEDTATNLYDAQFREYGIQGRWASPDPAGIAAANPANPQSWNRYAYALNMPLLFIDPFGLDPAGAPCSMSDKGKIDHPNNTVCVCNDFGCFFLNIALTVEAAAPLPPGAPLPPTEPPTEPINPIFNPVLNPTPFPNPSGNLPLMGGPGSPQKPTPQQQKCVAAAKARATSTVDNAIKKDLFLPLKAGFEGLVGGGLVGCLFTTEAGCLPGAALGGVGGALGGIVVGSFEQNFNMANAFIQADQQLQKDLAVCNNGNE